MCLQRFQSEQGVRVRASRDGQLHGLHGRGAEPTASVQPPEHPKDRGLLLQKLPKYVPIRHIKRQNPSDLKNACIHLI